MTREDGLEIFGCFILLLELASRAPKPARGLLVDADGPLTSADIADKTGTRQEAVARSLQVLCSKDIAWIELRENPNGVENENLPEPASNLPEPASNLPDPANDSRGGGKSVGTDKTERDGTVEEKKREEPQPKISQVPSTPRKNGSAAAPLTADEWKEPDLSEIADKLARELCPLHWVPSGIPNAKTSLEAKLSKAVDPLKFADGIRRAHEAARSKPRPKSIASQQFCFWINDEMYLSGSKPENQQHSESDMRLQKLIAQHGTGDLYRGPKSSQ